MKYKEVKKCNGDTLVGYSLFNLKNGQSKNLSTDNGESLIVLNKVNSFEYHKGFTPVEMSFEEIIVVMTQFNALYSFDKISLNKFLDALQMQIPDLYDEFKDLRDLEQKENLMTINIFMPITPDDEFSLN